MWPVVRSAIETTEPARWIQPLLPPSALLPPAHTSRGATSKAAFAPPGALERGHPRLEAEQIAVEVVHAGVEHHEQGLIVEQRGHEVRGGLDGVGVHALGHRVARELQPSARYVERALRRRVVEPRGGGGEVVRPAPHVVRTPAICST